jgi:hypothetical protein
MALEPSRHKFLESATLGWRHLLRERNLRSSLKKGAGYERVWRGVPGNAHWSLDIF